MGGGGGGNRVIGMRRTPIEAVCGGIGDWVEAIRNDFTLKFRGPILADHASDQRGRGEATAGPPMLDFS